MSTSEGNTWANAVSVTVTFATGDANPDTVMFDGYGVAVVLSLIAIAAGFANVCACADRGSSTRVPRHTTRAKRLGDTIGSNPFRRSDLSLTGTPASARI